MLNYNVFIDSNVRCIRAQHTPCSRPRREQRLTCETHAFDPPTPRSSLAQDLTDLAAIFSQGVLQSEVVILLGTKSVLSRPWCLLELYEARKHAIPVLTFAKQRCDK